MLTAPLYLQDPPRDGVTEGHPHLPRRPRAAHDDHRRAPRSPRAIAEHVGLALPGSPVLTAADLPVDEAVLGAAVDVDGAALREADIGIAMGRSDTEVAREAADLVLLDDDFATIVVAITYGRATFANIRRFLTYHLTDNVAELAPFVLWGLSGGGVPLTIGVLQILALDIGTDLLPALALGAEPPDRAVLKGPAQPGRLLDGRVLGRAFGVLGPVEAAVQLGAFVAVLTAGGCTGVRTPPPG